MSGDTSITVIGNLAGDAELRFTPSGAAVCNFTVASTPRKYDRETNQWQDGEPIFLRCNVWREQAENAAQTLTKGQRVIVSGRLKARTFDTEDGGRRTVLEIDVEDVGPSLRYASAQVTRTQRTERPQQDTPAESGDWGAGQVY